MPDPNNSDSDRSSISQFFEAVEAPEISQDPFELINAKAVELASTELDGERREIRDYITKELRKIYKKLEKDDIPFLRTVIPLPREDNVVFLVNTLERRCEDLFRKIAIGAAKEEDVESAQRRVNQILLSGPLSFQGQLTKLHDASQVYWELKKDKEKIDGLQGFIQIDPGTLAELRRTLYSLVSLPHYDIRYRSLEKMTKQRISFGLKEDQDCEPYAVRSKILHRLGSDDNRRTYALGLGRGMYMQTTDDLSSGLEISTANIFAEMVNTGRNLKKIYDSIGQLTDRLGIQTGSLACTEIVENLTSTESTALISKDDVKNFMDQAEGVIDYLEAVLDNAVSGTSLSGGVMDDLFKPPEEVKPKIDIAGVSRKSYATGGLEGVCHLSVELLASEPDMKRRIEMAGKDLKSPLQHAYAELEKMRVVKGGENLVEEDERLRNLDLITYPLRKDVWDLVDSIVRKPNYEDIRDLHFLIARIYEAHELYKIHGDINSIANTRAPQVEGGPQPTAEELEDYKNRRRTLSIQLRGKVGDVNSRLLHLEREANKYSEGKISFSFPREALYKNIDELVERADLSIADSLSGDFTRLFEVMRQYRIVADSKRNVEAVKEELEVEAKILTAKFDKGKDEQGKRTLVQELGFYVTQSKNMPGLGEKIREELISQRKYLERKEYDAYRVQMEGRIEQFELEIKSAQETIDTVTEELTADTGGTGERFSMLSEARDTAEATIKTAEQERSRLQAELDARARDYATTISKDNEEILYQQAVADIENDMLAVGYAAKIFKAAISYYTQFADKACQSFSGMEQFGRRLLKLHSKAHSLAIELNVTRNHPEVTSLLEKYQNEFGRVGSFVSPDGKEKRPGSVFEFAGQKIAELSGFLGLEQAVLRTTSDYLRTVLEEMDKREYFKFPDDLKLIQAGREHSVRGEYDKAVQYFDILIGRAPENAIVDVERGHALLGLGRAGDAVEAFRIGVNVNQSAMTYGALVYGLIKAGDTAEARTTLETALSKIGETENLSKLREALDNGTGVQAYWRDRSGSEREYRSDFEVNFATAFEGYCKCNEGKYAEGLPLIRRVLAEDPEFEPAQNWLREVEDKANKIVFENAFGGRVACNLGNYHEGIPRIREALKLNPNNKDAQKWLMEAEDHIRNDIFGYSFQAYMEGVSGNPDIGRQKLNLVLSIVPGYESAKNWLKEIDAKSEQGGN